jgi:hypothetical protein
VKLQSRECAKIWKLEPAKLGSRERAKVWNLEHVKLQSRERAKVWNLEPAKPRSRELVKTRSHEHAKLRSHELIKTRIGSLRNSGICWRSSPEVTAHEEKIHEPVRTKVKDVVSKSPGLACELVAGL